MYLQTKYQVISSSGGSNELERRLNAFIKEHPYHDIVKYKIFEGLTCFFHYILIRYCEEVWPEPDFERFLAVWGEGL